MVKFKIAIVVLIMLFTGAIKAEENDVREDILVARITPSDIFMGEMAFLLQNHRSATVIANCPGKIIKISRNSYINAIKKFPHYGILLSKLLAKKLVRANEFKVHGELTKE